MTTPNMAAEAIARQSSEQVGTGGMPPVGEPEHPLAAELRRVLSEPEKHDIGTYAALVKRIMAELDLVRDVVAPGDRT